LAFPRQQQQRISAVADQRHKRDTNARRLPKAHIVAGPLAILATASTVGLGVLATSPQVRETLAASSSSDIANASADRTADSTAAARGEIDISRSGSRVDSVHLVREYAVDMTPAAVAKAVRNADTNMWTTTELNLWTTPGEDAKQVGVIEEGKKVLITGRTAVDRIELVVDGEARWVTAGYLAEEKPVAAAAGLSMDPCPDPGVESGLTSNAVYVYRSVCNAFPMITSYGGWDAHGEHSTGRALDIMTSDPDVGYAIAEFLQAHAAELNLYDIIYRQQIWTPERAAEGWRPMEDRGSATANHFDHVHVSTY
jgi:hypothetical protein